MDRSQDKGLYLKKSVKMKHNDSQLEVNPPSHFARAGGILKYLRESKDDKVPFDSQTEAPSDYLIQCEYCGEEVSPSLAEICTYGSRGQEELFFCCEEWEQLFWILLKMRNVLEGKSADDNSANKEMMYRRKEDKHSMFLIDSTKEHKSEPRLFKDYLTEMPLLGNVAQGSNVMSVRLSCPPQESWVKLPKYEPERRENILDANFKETELSVSICDHKSLNFGLCHYQNGSGTVNRYYADGLKFLLVLDDGSAQVFYPSGLLAILVIVTKAHGRVCIVYDDAPGQPMRALFQSDGKGTCYHTNGNIWLNINKYRGQCLDPEGAQVHRWTWHKVKSDALRPIFLSINKCIGIRVLGEHQIFVSFLANGKQAKFSVGPCCHKGNYGDVQPPSKFAKDELILLASRIKTKLLIQKIHRFISLPSLPRLPNTVPSRQLHVLAQELSKAGEKIQMSGNDSNFLQNCLKEIL